MTRNIIKSVNIRAYPLRKEYLFVSIEGLASEFHGLTRNKINPCISVLVRCKNTDPLQKIIRCVNKNLKKLVICYFIGT